MVKIISNIQNKPEKQKKVLAIILASGITVIIFSLWLANFSRKISVSSDDTKKQAREIISPIGSLMNIFDTAMDEIGNIFVKTKEGIEGI